MTKIQDFRLSESHFKPFIGKCFRKYRCDSFDYTNSVTGVVGIYINDKTFELRNEQESIQYFDSVDDRRTDFFLKSMDKWNYSFC